MALRQAAPLGVVQLADVATTLRVIHLGGVELNPVGRALLAGGAEAVLVAKVAVFLVWVACWWWLERQGRVGVVAAGVSRSLVAGLMLGVVTINGVQLLQHGF